MHPLIAIPAIAALLYRAYSHSSLKPLGLVVAGISATIHATYPSALPFTLLGVFFLGGTATTKIKHDIKSTLTLSSTGSSPPSSTSSSQASPRTHVQVLANSGIASFLILISLSPYGTAGSCYSYSNPDLVLTGVIANYAAVAADTFSSELGILSRTKPRLITSFRTVPPGTNGGVTSAGLLAGLGGAATIALAAVLLTPFCAEQWTVAARIGFVAAVTVWGGIGSVLDSLLGALFQASVVDKRTGKIVEGEGGEKVLVIASPGGDERILGKVAHREKSKDDDLHQRKKGPKQSEHDQSSNASRAVLAGRDWLDNNQINVSMAAIMSFGAMGLASLIR